MLVKYENNTSSVMIPLNTAFAMNGGTQAYGGEATMSLQPMLSTEKVFFPGENALAIAEHQTYDSDTNSFIGINQIANSINGGVGGGDGWGESVNLTSKLMSTPWYKNFNRIENWLEFSKYPANESANYYSNVTATGLKVTPNNETTNYTIGISSIMVLLNEGDNTAHSADLKRWANYNDDPNRFEITLQCNTYTEMYGRYFILGTAINQLVDTASNSYSAECVAFVTPTFPDYHQSLIVRNFKKCQYHNMVVWEGSQPEPLLTYTIPNPKEVLYTSGITATVSNIQTDASDTLTGTDLSFSFDTTGNGVTGQLIKPYIGMANVTANVEFTSAKNGVTSHNVSDYRWANSTAQTGTVGGGGGYEFNMDLYPIPFSNKNVNIPTQMGSITSMFSGQQFRMKSTNNIPDYFGGSILFSGDYLDSHYNAVETQYFYIGFKGTSMTTLDMDDKTDPTKISDNFGFKIYKFNSDHFKKINNGIYAFYDDRICKMYSTWEASENMPLKEKTYMPIGPFFMKPQKIQTYTITANSRIPTNDYSLNLGLLNILPVPTVLDSISYIKSFDPEVETNNRYLITKPASSFTYASDGFDKNYGSTDTYTYLAMQLPSYCKANARVGFYGNLTEITNIGTSMTAITGYYNAQPLSNLTAIKSNWANCYNVTDMNGLFNNATALREIPDSWYGLFNLTAAQSTFSNCSSLSAIPNTWFGLTRLKNCYGMFYNCTNLSSIPTDFNSMTNLSDIRGMFEGCTSLTSDIGPILDYIKGHFYPGASTVYLNMFKGCTGVHSGSNTYSQITADSTSTAWYNYIFGLV